MAPAHRNRHACLVAASCITFAFASSAVPDAPLDPALAGGDAAVPNEPPPSIRHAHGADGGRRRGLGLAHAAHGKPQPPRCKVCTWGALYRTASDVFSFFVSVESLQTSAH